MKKKQNLDEKLTGAIVRRNWVEFREVILNLEKNKWRTHKEIAIIIQEKPHSTYCGLSLLVDEGIIEIRNKHEKPYYYRVISA